MTLSLQKAYEALGLSPGATRQEVKAAYRDLIAVWHPDRFQANPRLVAKAEEKLKELNEARQIVFAALEHDAGSQAPPEPSRHEEAAPQPRRHEPAPPPVQGTASTSAFVRSFLNDPLNLLFLAYVACVIATASAIADRPVHGFLYVLQMAAVPALFAAANQRIRGNRHLRATYLIFTVLFAILLVADGAGIRRRSARVIEPSEDQIVITGSGPVTAPEGKPSLPAPASRPEGAPKGPVPPASPLPPAAPAAPLSPVVPSGH